MEGKKVREVAIRLSMSEADLYRKQRVAIEAVAKRLPKWNNRPGKSTFKLQSSVDGNIAVLSMEKN